jgi:hypothetical protein
VHRKQRSFSRFSAPSRERIYCSAFRCCCLASCLVGNVGDDAILEHSIANGRIRTKSGRAVCGAALTQNRH